MWKKAKKKEMKQNWRRLENDDISKFWPILPEIISGGETAHVSAQIWTFPNISKFPRPLAPGVH